VKLSYLGAELRGPRPGDASDDPRLLPGLASVSRAVLRGR